jgi:hypothetical protein
VTFREILDEVLLAYSTGKLKPEDFKPHSKTDAKKYQQSLDLLLSENKDSKVLIDITMLSPYTITSSVELSPRVYLKDLSLLRVVNHLHSNGYSPQFNEILHDLRQKVKEWYSELVYFLKNPNVLTISETVDEMREFIDKRKAGQAYPNLFSAELNQLNALENSLNMMTKEERVIGRRYLEGKRGRNTNKVVKRIVSIGADLYNERRESEYQIGKSSKQLLAKAMAKSIRTKENIIILSNIGKIRDLVKLIEYSFPNKPDKKESDDVLMAEDARVAVCRSIFDDFGKYKVELGGWINFIPAATIPRVKKHEDSDYALAD